MCGISLLLQCIQLQNIELLIGLQTPGTQQKLGDLKTYLNRRGPDSYHTRTIDNGIKLSLSGAVLHLRGSHINAQPLTDDHGNMLLWNGEVFDGVQLGDNENDTLKVFKVLTESSVFDIHKIEGPFAFIYYQHSTNQIWFGRDCLGRRSLLFAYNQDAQCFALSSIPYQSENIKCNHWMELPNTGIFCLDLNDGTFTHHCWSQMMQQNNDHEDDAKDSEVAFLYSKLDLLSLFGAQLSHVKYEEIQDAFLNVLCNAIKKRVMIPESSKSLRHRYLMDSPAQWMDTVYRYDVETEWKTQQDKECVTNEASIGIMYSGGIDSQILAALCDRFIPAHESIDLINVVCGDDTMSSPDRLTAINGLLELKQCINPKRNWRLIKVNISYKEICEAKARIVSLIYPCCTIMDFNIGNVLWFGARGIGYVKSNEEDYKWIKQNKLVRYAHIDLQLKQEYETKLKNVDVDAMVKKQIQTEFDGQLNGKEKSKQIKYEMHKQKRKRAKEMKKEILNGIKQEVYGNEKEEEDEGKEALYVSSSRVLLLGFGSDELLGGYGRHRTSFRTNGEEGLKRELDKDFKRLWKRNLGRDDRLISDHSREARWPFLDEEFISLVKQLPLECVCNLNESIGFGDKKLLRDCAQKIGLKYSWSLVKRAIQFGSRIANNKVAGYVDMNDELQMKDLINSQIYDQKGSGNPQVNVKITKKYNKKKGKKGYL